MTKRLLLVEGKDDKHVVMHICGNREGPRLDRIKIHEGVKDLIGNLTEELRSAVDEGDVVGIVVDADLDIERRWVEVRNQILKANYKNVPIKPSHIGTIIEPPEQPPLPRVGVWIMPNNQTSGNLEHFLRFLVPQPDPLFDHAENSIASFPSNCQRFTDADQPKALIHTWLAWQKEPGCPYGTAITARFLCPDVPEVDIFVKWLRQLFS